MDADSCLALLRVHGAVCGAVGAVVGFAVGAVVGRVWTSAQVVRAMRGLPPRRRWL